MKTMALHIKTREHTAIKVLCILYNIHSGLEGHKECVYVYIGNQIKFVKRRNRSNVSVYNMTGDPQSLYLGHIYKIADRSFIYFLFISLFLTDSPFFSFFFFCMFVPLLLSSAAFWKSVCLLYRYY